MASVAKDNGAEMVLSDQPQTFWLRREQELEAWVRRDKRRLQPKRMVAFESFTADAELVPALSALRSLGIPTEYSCAGVSVLDDPFDHSLYAYITFYASENTERFVQFAAAFMKHRLLVTFEPGRSRYDLSSFFIGHNRSFCLLMQRCAEAFERLGEQHSE